MNGDKEDVLHGDGDDTVVASDGLIQRLRAASMGEFRADGREGAPEKDLGDETVVADDALVEAIRDRTRSGSTASDRLPQSETTDHADATVVANADPVHRLSEAPEGEPVKSGNLPVPEPAQLEERTSDSPAAHGAGTPAETASGDDDALEELKRRYGQGDPRPPAQAFPMWLVAVAWAFVLLLAIGLVAMISLS